MAQAEGTSKNDGKVGSKDSGAAKGSSGSGSSSGGFNLGGGQTSYHGGDSGGVNSVLGGGGGSNNSGGYSGRSLTTDGRVVDSSGRSISGAIGRALGSFLGAATPFGAGVGGALGGAAADFGFGDIGATSPVPTGGLVGEEAATGKKKAEADGFGNIKNEVARTIAETWSGLGWSKSDIAAGLGNLDVESGGFKVNAKNPGDAKNGTDSMHLAQWNQDRLTGLENYAAEKGVDLYGDPIQSARVQAEYVNHEMQTTHKNAWNAMQNADTLDGKVAAWQSKYEVATDKHNNRRMASANQFAGALDGINEVGDVSAPTQTAGKKTAKNNDPLGIQSAIAGAIFDATGIQVGLGKQKDGSYRDPMVSSVEGRTARGEDANYSVDSTVKREGLAGIGQSIESKKPGQAIKGIASAIKDPIGFALDTIMDFGKNSRMMNTPGAEGVGGDGKFGLGFLDGLISGFSGSGGGGPVNTSGGSNNSGGSPIKKKKKAPTMPATNLEVSQNVPAKPRSPYDWSLL